MQIYRTGLSKQSLDVEDYRLAMHLIGHVLAQDLCIRKYLNMGHISNGIQIVFHYQLSGDRTDLPSKERVQKTVFSVLLRISYLQHEAGV